MFTRLAPQKRYHTFIVKPNPLANWAADFQDTKSSDVYLQTLQLDPALGFPDFQQTGFPLPSEPQRFDSFQNWRCCLALGAFHAVDPG